MSIISKDISKAISLLESEALVAIPTETVYGLAGNIFSEKAIKAIFRVKQRPRLNPLIVHIASAENLKSIVSHIPTKAQILAEVFWPGPLTLVLPKKEHIPDLITSGKPTVAVRIPNHPMALELLKNLKFPLAAPSANPFSRISPTAAHHVESYFSNDIKMVLDGGSCKKGIESTIIGFKGEEPVVYRLGSIPLEAIEEVIGPIEIKTKEENVPDAPGMLERHYAPNTKIILTSNIKADIQAHRGLKIGVLVFNELLEGDDISFKVVLSNTGSKLEEAASRLYDALHILDREKLDIIIAERLPDYGLGKSINDRLERATK